MSTANKEVGGKISYCDLPYESIESMAKVFQFSKQKGKYPRDNHFKPMHITHMLDAIQRHLKDLMISKDLDDETKMSHFAHIMADAAMAEYHFLNKTLIDDRIKRPKEFSKD